MNAAALHAVPLTSGYRVGVIIMSDVVPLRNRGTWQGVANIIFASGQATGAPLGGFLADMIGWRW